MMKRLIYSNSDLYKLDVVPECNDEDDNPACWSLTFQDDNGDNHFIWITKYDDNEYVVEDSEGRNLAKNLVYKTFSGAKRKAEEVVRRQIMRDLFTN